MSFSSKIKERMCAAKADCPSCAESEAAGILCFSGAAENGGVAFSTLSTAVSDRLAGLLYGVFGLKPRITRRGSSGAYVFFIPFENAEEYFENIFSLGAADMPECCENSFLRGAFLGCGSVSDPEKNWHLEFDTKTRRQAELLCSILVKKDIRAKITRRKEHFIVYIKDCDSIADFLASAGDNGDALKLFNIQIERGMRSDINRRVNFESANLDKSAKASSRHIRAIRKIKAAGEWDKLPDVLKEIGELRIENPEASLKELGEMLSPPIGKSGVNHRLNRLMEIAGDG